MSHSVKGALCCGSGRDQRLDGLVQEPALACVKVQPGPVLVRMRARGTLAGSPRRGRLRAGAGPGDRDEACASGAQHVIEEKLPAKDERGNLLQAYSVLRCTSMVVPRFYLYYFLSTLVYLRRNLPG